MTPMLRSVLLLSACAVSAACMDERVDSPKPKAPSIPSAVSVAEPKLALAKDEPSLAAVAPAAPTTILDKPLAAKPEEAKPGAVAPDAAQLALGDHEVEPVDYERPLDPGEVKIDRFVLAHGVDQREPVEESERFTGDTKIFAFVQLANPEGAPFAFRVHWEKADGPVSQYGVKLNVETAPRYRTWSWTAIPREPGAYKAVLRTLDGKEIAVKPFTIEASSER
jgi:Protein of unknown function (DUF2914)